MTSDTSCRLCSTSNPAKSSTMPDHLGDIMAFSARSTSENHAHLFNQSDFSGLERIALTANGNLQRIISAFHNSPVSVSILFNNRHPSSTNQTATYHRAVHLSLPDRLNSPFAVALSIVEVSHWEWVHWLTDHGVGIGQLFRYARLLPECQVLHVGRNWDVSKNGLEDSTESRMLQLVQGRLQDSGSGSGSVVDWSVVSSWPEIIRTDVFDE